MTILPGSRVRYQTAHAGAHTGVVRDAYDAGLLIIEDDTDHQRYHVPERRILEVLA